MWNRAVRLHAELPVFRIGGGSRVIIYTPGYLSVVSRNEVEPLVRSLRGEPGGDARAKQLASALLPAAVENIARWRSLNQAAFQPRCLTLYLHNECNLRCGYCFSRAGRTGPGAPMPSEAIAAAAATVARHCRRAGCPLTVVLSGGGEPTLHWSLLRQAVSLTRAAAAREGLAWKGAIVTNGVVSARRAAWLVRTFSSIELSCDGPPDIQDRQRPGIGNRRSSAVVERTARILEGARHIAVRSTITPESMMRQAEIVDYVVNVLGLRSLRFEPAYHLRCRAASPFRAGHAAAFVENFLRAQERARASGAELCFAGSRLDEIHGPYCSSLKQALHLTPQGTATQCFFALPPQAAASSAALLCDSCFNQYHCARECPERCRAGPVSPQDAGFRCRVQRLLAEAWLMRAAGL